MEDLPAVDLQEVLPLLSERGKIEWELAVTKAQLQRVRVQLAAMTPSTIAPIEGEENAG